MRFISKGDFVFPFNFKTYLNEQMYLWSYNNGVPNPDEILRFFIRLPNLLVYTVTGSNLAVSYFYIALVILACLLSFRYFCKEFLHIKDKKAIYALSLFYTFNPIFLGNYAKIGLILAVTMLPLLLTYAKKFVSTEKFLYLVLIIFALNVSFIHPFCLIVNSLLFLGYFIFKILPDKKFIYRNFIKLAAGFVLFLLINAYIAISILSIGSVSKSTISQNLSDQSLSSANISAFANTGDLLTAFSLSKNVFLDFQFFNASYMPVYYIGAFMMFALFVWLYANNYGSLSSKYKKYLLISLLLVLVFIILTTGTFYGVDKLLSTISTLPGGWAFRSPLKWQLYIPLFIFASAALLIEVQLKRLKKYTLLALGIVFVAVNGYVGHEVITNLLIPKNSVVSQAVINSKELDHRTLLVKGDRCRSYFLKDFTLLSNIREAYAAKGSQLKEIDLEDIDTINISSFNEILTCEPILSLNYYDFKMQGAITEGSKPVFSYKNLNPKSKVYITSLINIDDMTYNLANKQRGLDSLTDSHFDFINDNENINSEGFIKEVFENIGSVSVGGGEFTDNVEVPKSKENYLISESPLYFKEDAKNKKVYLNNSQQKDYTRIKHLHKLSDGFANGNIRFTYKDDNYSFNNLINNGSLENGLWRSKVSDCFNYDAYPKIKMNLSKNEFTDGSSSLELSADSHIACTSPNRVKVNELKPYLLYFDYKTSGGAARYNITFEGSEKFTQNINLKDTESEWSSYSNIVYAPKGSDLMQVTLYGLPSLQKSNAKTYYDNIKVIEVPEIFGKVFVGSVSGDANQPKVNYKTISPVRTDVSVSGAKGTINLVLNDTYHRGWKLTNGNKILSAKHAKLNRQDNVWQLDAEDFCRQNNVCTANSDGTFNMKFAIFFVPQKMLSIGLVISGIALAGSLVYIIYEKFPLKIRKGKSKIKR